MKRGPQSILDQHGRNIKARTEDYVSHSDRHRYKFSQDQISADLRNQQANVILSSFQVTLDREHDRLMSKISEEDQQKINTFVNSLKM